MIRFLDNLASFTSEAFRAKRAQNKKKPNIFKRVLGYSLVTISLLGNYFLIKKVYSLSVTNYAYYNKLKEYKELPKELTVCSQKNDVLIAIIDNSLDKIRPIKRPDDSSYAISQTNSHEISSRNKDNPLVSSATVNSSEKHPASQSSLSAQRRDTVRVTDDSHKSAIDRNREKRRQLQNHAEKS